MGKFIAVGWNWEILTNGELQTDGEVVFPESAKDMVIKEVITPSGFLIPVKQPVEEE